MRRKASSRPLTAVSSGPVRHFRGHNVHSPFAYSLIREGFMGSADGCREELRAALRGAGVTRRKANVICRIYRHCGYTDFVIAENSASLKDIDGILIIPGKPDADMISACAEAVPSGAVCITAPRHSRRTREACLGLIDRRHSLSIEKAGMLVLFFDSKLSKQHIKL